MTLQELIALNEKKNGGKAAPSEHALQVACVRWFRYAYPWPRYLIFSIPNGGYRTETTARAMKAEGQKPGIPDLCIPMARKGYHGLYIELKNGKAGQLSKYQKEKIEFLTREGYLVVVCRNLIEFQKIVQNYFAI